MSDSLGNWEVVGTVTVGDDWQLLSNPVMGESIILRITYNTNWFEWQDYAGNRSYGLIRMYYQSENTTVSPSLRIYPKQAAEIRTINSPLSVIKYIGVKRIHYYRRYGFYSAIPVDWELQIEQLIA